MDKVQILYPGDNTNQLHQHFIEESEAMKLVGFIVDYVIHPDASKIIYRGFSILKEQNYPTHSMMIQSWRENKRTLLMSEFLPIIDDLSIPTFFADSLSIDVEEKILAKNWSSVFIKADAKSLFALGDNASVWPNTPLKKMAEEYEKRNITGPFAIRKFIDNPEIFYDEQRYWVLNGHAYHPNGIIPNFVNEAAKRLYHFSGSHYFTIDVAGSYIVEVNPGESSDRGGDNPLEFFCKIFAKEFLS